MHDSLVRRWWILVLRGVAAIAFGVLTFVAPRSSVVALVILFGAYALVDGIFNLAGFIRAPRGRRRWGPFIFEGVAGVLAGLLTFLWPQITALVLISVIAAWAIIMGVTALVAAVRLRKQIEGEWLLAVNGVLSLAFGVLLLLFPGPGALALILWVGAYAFLAGIIYLVLGLRLRSRGRTGAEPTSPLQPGPSPA
jgi:uncharacterized membrane protein HdeD (DUF308 family)